MDWSYLAGFTDGDGHISNCVRVGKNGNPQYIVAISWGQEESAGAVLYEIQTFLAEHGYAAHIYRNSTTQKNPQLQLNFHRIKQIEEVLRALEPFLIVKKVEARRAIEALEERKLLQARYGRHIWARLADDGMRVCSVCGVKKEWTLGNFYAGKSGKPGATCKACKNDYQRDYYCKNQELRLSYARKYRNKEGE